MKTLIVIYIYVGLGNSQNITKIPTLKFFKPGPITGVSFEFGLLDKVIGDLKTFIDRQMGTTSNKVYNLGAFGISLS